jgi:hypothetical protein
LTDGENMENQETPFLPGYPEPLVQLRDLSDEEIERRHSEVVKVLAQPLKAEAKQPYIEQASTYLNELARRETSRQGERMEALTGSINRLTVIIAIATIIGVILTALALILG